MKKVFNYMKGAAARLSVGKAAKKKAAIFAAVLFVSALVGNRIQEIRNEGVQEINNIVRIHSEAGAPKEYVVAKKTIDFLEMPLFIKNGRALVSAQRVGLFAPGQKIKGTKSKITSVSRRLDLDTGMFVVAVSGNLTGNFMVQAKYDGFFLPVEAELPDGVRIVARDSARMVALGLEEGDKVVVR